MTPPTLLLTIRPSHPINKRGHTARTEPNRDGYRVPELTWQRTYPFGSRCNTFAGVLS